MFLLYVVILILGFVSLIKGADLFVDGSSALAKTFHVSGLIIGLTIVAFGTSAPELAVSTVAAINGSNEIALSNVVGSNIFNLLCVLGVCALIHPVPVEAGINKRDFPLSILITLFVLFATSASSVVTGAILKLDMNKIAGKVSRPVGVILLLIFICYIAYLIYDARKHPQKDEDMDRQPVLKSLCFIIIGIVLIVAGGKAVVYGAKAIARTFGMTETLIGLTIVAVGTSLPELVTSIVAARKGETGLAVGNVVGSNIFNLMFILGVSSTIHPIYVNVASVWDILILSVVSIVTYIFCNTKSEINRREGIIMLLIYVADVIFAVLR
ncbi:MAG: calcium/sodium antiporter [Lachnospiraceae bacterium]|nr:calcium/sodium antiporter [Lachnospiraceae bacterium]